MAEKFKTGDKVRCVSMDNHPTTDWTDLIKIGEVYTISRENLLYTHGRDYIVTLMEVDAIKPDRPYFNENDFEYAHLPASTTDTDDAWNRAMGVL